MKKQYRLLTIVSMVLLLSCLLQNSRTNVHAQQSCTAVFSLFARGSGEKIDDNEWRRYNSQLTARITSLTSSELGSQSYAGHKYPAVNVNPWTHGGTLLGAAISAGYDNRYGDSVMEGENELFYRLVDIHSNCPNSRIVLAGYSQGAQVMGQALHAIDDYPEIRGQIEFVALFGDPKLNLPEGRGLFPPACRKEQYSPWRREVPDCNTDNGALGARDPYVPSSMEKRVGLWCNDNDLVCGSSKFAWVDDGHGEYYKDNGPIDHAVHEIAKRIKTRTDMEDVNLAPNLAKIPAGHPDVVIVTDNSTENAPAWEQSVVPTVFAIADKVTQQGGRVGLQTYNGCAKKGYTYDIPLSHDPAQIEQLMRTLWHFNARCDLSQDLIDTLKRIKNSADWKANRNRMIIVVPKIPFSAPAATIAASLNHQPDLHLYSIESTSTDSSYDYLRIGSYKNTPIGLSDVPAVLVENTTNPQVVANLRNPNIQARPGDVVEFNASNSLVYDDTIDHYDWDFDGNGTTDQTTTEPEINHIYTIPFSGKMSVTVVTVSGVSDSTTREVLVQPASMFKQPAKAPVNLKLTKLSDSSVRFSWEPGDDSAIAWLVKMDGFPLGYTMKNQHFVNVSDVPMAKTHIFSVQALADENVAGEVATISTATIGSSPDDPATKKDDDVETSKALTDILGDKSKKSNEGSPTNPAAQAVAKLSPAARSAIRGSLIFIVVASVVVAAILSWQLYKRRKSLF